MPRRSIMRDVVSILDRKKEGNRPFTHAILEKYYTLQDNDRTLLWNYRPHNHQSPDVYLRKYDRYGNTADADYK